MAIEHEKKMTACFIQAFDLFPYLFCYFQGSFNTFIFEKIWGSKRNETDKWPIIQTYWKTLSLHLLYIEMQTELKTIPTDKIFAPQDAVWTLS